MLDNKASASVLLGNFLHHLFITLPDLLLNYGSLLFFLAGFYFIFRIKLIKTRCSSICRLGLILASISF